ncbi:FAD-binding oxidoreductase [Parasphingopyxis algicola]|uniref:FAD-binding oxidoreductase n=1 Tax=Parasphingopyxis algicola TaxID=2026624 RepID=UPI0015A3346E|nr:FAD-binding oxidoreductase [Parasphingopyxis algicola]QLC23712.1 FAD-binding oxidoreductase [Parasphingopyxis algicola]
MDDQTILERLAAIVGPAALGTTADDLEPWLTDWRGRVTGSALALASPGSVAEVQAIVRLAGEAGIALVPQGGNTGMVAGGVPRPDDRAILLSLRRMNAIRSIDPADNSLTAEAGAILSTVHAVAKKHGRRFPLSLGAKDSATIGGLIATNAGGTQVLRFGSMRALTLGVEAVLPDGSLFEGLSTLRKDNRGYDLRQLLAGSEGTLGVITAASLKLVPAAPHRTVAWAGLDSAEKALALLRALEAALGDAVESFELVPDTALALVLQHIPNTRAPLDGPHRWHVLIELRTATSAEDLRARSEVALAKALKDGLIVDAVLAESEAQAADFWKLREVISEAERLDGMAAKHDVSVPVSAMPGFIESAAAAVERRFAGARVIAFGHLGDGNVHFNVRAPAGSDDEAWFAETGDAVSRFVHDLTRDAGGSLSAEHGIGQLKLAEFGRLADPVRLAALRAIKDALDPRGIMNPGKLVPLANPAENP